MRQWAEQSFGLDVRDKNGSTDRERLEALLSRDMELERRAEIEAQLDGPAFPEGFDYLLAWFYDLGPALFNGMGLAPISYTEIRSWRLERGLQLNSWEVKALRELSQVYCEVQGGRKPQRTPVAAVTPQAFDAVFG